MTVKRTSFHHGNLREALVERARAILRSDGIEALSLREVAGKERVSHAAVYRHFASRGALLAAVATVGFVELTARLERARAAASGPADELGAIGRAYVRFAVDEPHLFRVMYGPELATRGAYPELDAAARAAFAIVLLSVRSAQRAKVVRREPAHELAQVAWSLAHGVAILAVDAQIADADRLAERASRVLRRGLTPD